MLAIAELEGGKPGQWARNDNGTYDVGAICALYPRRFLADPHPDGAGPVTSSCSLGAR
jgi:hypothetical protein